MAALRGAGQGKPVDANDILKRAWKAVKESGVPEALHETAFIEAIALIRGAHAGDAGGGATPRTTPAPPPSPTPGAPNGSAGVPNGTYAKIAHETGVPVEDLQQVFYVEDGGDERSIKLVVPARKLGSAKSTQARSVVAIVAGARHAAFDENQVSSTPIREECGRVKCYDASNFTKHVDALAGFNLRDGVFFPNAKWIDDFKSAVGQALNKTYEDD